MSALKKTVFLLGLAALLPSASGARVDFNRDIRSILSNNCFACHGPDDKERGAGLRLDTRDGVFKDLGGYAAVVPGKPDESELIARITTSDEDDIMPPPKKGKRLSPKEVQLLRDWIAQGAEFAVHWSYAPVQRPEPPQLAKGESARNAIDHFALRKLRQHKLQPSPKADRWTLARRAAIDLIGLPPTVEELDEFINDTRPDAFDRYVDRLLTKDAFGEHWAGMWLDLARYADSAGYPSDPGREIWAYRDWVIKAFNDNLPFDQFTIEQIAGDLLPQPKESQLIATAFHRNTMTQNEGGTSDEEFRNEAIIDRVNTTMAVWMGTSMSCAQCHTHKYDPITQSEYFQFFAILNNTADADKRDESPLFSFLTNEQERQRQDWEQKIAAIKDQFAQPKTEWLKGYDAWAGRLAEPLKWNSSSPELARSQSGTKLRITDNGTVLASASKKTDSYIVELPLTGDTLTAIKLDALNDKSLPKQGPGLSGGNFVISKITAQIVPDPKKSRQGRHVRIELPGQRPLLQLAEVQVFRGDENVALKGKASQISNYRDAVASRAIDGKTDGDYHKGSVAHTGGKSKLEWWEVELPETTAIDRIVIWNRTDGGTGARLMNFTVKVLDEERRIVWSHTETSSPKKDISFAVNGPTTVKFRTALADYEQKGFPASATIVEKPAKNHTGWGVGGKTGEPHQLSLIAGVPVAIPEGAKLRVVLRQNSKYAQHLLGHFRISFTSDARAAAQLKIPEPILAALHKPADQRAKDDTRRLQDYYLRNVAPETRRQRTQLASLTKSLGSQKKTTVPVMRELEADKRRTTRVQIRGNFQNLADEVSEGVPAAFHPLPKGAPKNRLSLGRWLVDRANPLTARVTVNRFWERLFGNGLVSTSEEFGSQGEPPSHPELLDWLAAEFMDSGWDTKKLLKLIVTSGTWMQSTKVTPKLLAADPENRLLTRGPRFRSTGEVLRDQALFVSGLLSEKMFGPPVKPMRPNLGLRTAFGGANDWTPSKGEDAHRRSVYTLIKRNSPYPSFTTFDAPSREVCTLRRSRSNTPLQAFVTLNDPVFVETAQAFARRIVGDGGKDTAGRLKFAFLTATSRPPNAVETKRLRQLLADAKAVYSADTELAKKMATDPLGDAGKDADYIELASWTAVANVILNLDEMIMRR